MALALVEDYHAAWNFTQDKGTITFKIASRDRLLTIPFGIASEFSAMMALLTSEKAVFLDLDTGLLSTRGADAQNIA